MLRKVEWILLLLQTLAWTEVAAFASVTVTVCLTVSVSVTVYLTVTVCLTVSVSLGQLVQRSDSKLLWVLMKTRNVSKSMAGG